MDTIGLYLMATCVFSVTYAQVSDGCNSSLGMKNGGIQDRQLTSSSFYTDDSQYNYDATEGRLDGLSCWGTINLDLDQWIRVDFDTPMYVSGIVSQGNPHNQYLTWVTAYMVQYSIDNSSWQYVKDTNHDDAVFQGNSNINSHVTRIFTSEVRVTSIRIRPTEWNNYIGMRFEILGCEAICVPECVHETCSAPNTCACNEEYTGSSCDTPICVPECVQGTCSAPNTCTCNEGYTGSSCDTPICVPECVKGTCSAPNTCTCNEGYTGLSCHTPICVPECVHGTCSAPNTCTCNEGYTGLSCHTPIATRASVVTRVATSSALVSTESSVTASTIEALTSNYISDYSTLPNQKSTGSASTTAGASIAFVFLLLIIVCIVVLVVVKRRRRQQQQESSKSQTVIQLDGPYGETVTNIVASPPTKDAQIYAGVLGANGDAVAAPTEELYQDVSDKPGEVQQGTYETYQDITEEAKGNPSTHDNDIYQDVQDNEYTYAHVDTVRDKVPSVDGDLVQIYAKSQYGGALHSAENRNQQEGWVDNDIYAMSDEDIQLKRQTGGDNREEGWVENDIYARSDEDQLKRQGEDIDKEEGWMDNSIYATTDE